MPQELVAPDDLGPAMRALVPMRRAFVLAYCTNGCKATDAAREAGYVDNNNGSIKVTAHRILHNPTVRAAIREWTLANIQGNLPIYKKLLDEIAFNPHHRDQARVLLELTTRAGLPAVVEKNINVNVTVSNAEKIAKIRELAEKHGLNAAELIGNITQTEAVDADFEELGVDADA